MFKTYLKETLVYVIGHFSVESKKHFNLSLTLIIIGTILALIIGVIFLLIGACAFGYFNVNTFWGDILTNVHLLNQIKALMNGIGILGIGLYGSFIISTINDDRLNTKPEYTLKDFRMFISPEEWRSFFVLLLVLIAFHFINFKSMVSWFHYDRVGFYAYAQMDSKSQVVEGLLSWIDSVINLISTYLPFLLSTLFIITIYGNKLDKQVIKEFKAAILTSMFLAFCINTLAIVFIGYIDRYAIGFVKALMPTSFLMLIPGVIKLCTYMVLAAYFNWCASASLCLPVKLHAEREESVDEGHNVELPL